MNRPQRKEDGSTVGFPLLRCRLERLREGLPNEGSGRGGIRVIPLSFHEPGNLAERGVLLEARCFERPRLDRYERTYWFTDGREGYRVVVCDFRFVQPKTMSQSYQHLATWDEGYWHLINYLRGRYEEQGRNARSAKRHIQSLLELKVVSRDED
jgi:hypothetical protein